MPSYYSEYGGFVMGAAIDKYIYIDLHDIFIDKVIAHYSKSEMVDKVDQIQHPIIREALKLTGLTERIEVGTMADIPARAGLGSSGSFTVGLLKALHYHKKDYVPQQDLAEEACKIEIELLKDPTGKQDQYIAAFGGIISLTFNRDGTVLVEPLRLTRSTIDDLENNLLMFFTGFSRKSHSVLKRQDSMTKKKDGSMIENLHHVKEIGYESRDALKSGDTRHFGELMHIHWLRKKKRSPHMSNPKIDRWYNLAMKNGAIGGKLVGGGGGGFLMMYAKDPERLRKAMIKENLREVKFSFDYEGAKVIVGT